jgi:PAS domain S-box-containing protein
MSRAVDATPETPEPGLLVSELPDPVAVIDGTGTIMWGNPAAVRFFGEGAIGLIGTSIFDLVHPEDVHVVRTSVANMHAKQVGTPIEIRVRTSTGWKLVEVVGSNQLREPAIGGLIVSLRDITERRRWEVARDQTSRFRALVHNASTILMLLDEQGHVESVSAAVTRILGHDQEWVEGQSLSTFVHERDRDRLEDALGQALAASGRKVGSATVQLDMVHATSDEPVPFELNIVNLLDDPTVVGMVVSAHDISRLRSSLTQLEEAQAQLVRKERLSALGEMASMIGHELRNPLNAVMNGLFLLRQDLGELDDEPEQLMTMVEQQAGQAVKLAEEITAYMRQRDPELVDLKLRSVIDDVLEATPPPPGVGIEVPVSDISVRADRLQLAQMLTNLVINAYQAMPEGGAITVRAYQEDPWIVIVVEDSGKGVDPSIAHRVFEPFVSSKPLGTGLGLAIVRRLVEAHHGTVSLATGETGGTTLTLRLPLETAES